MADEEKSNIYIAFTDGERTGFFRATDARLVRKHILDGIYPPKIEVRQPSTEETWDAALDGIAIRDIRPKPGDPAADDLLQPDAPPAADDAPAPNVYIDPLNLAVGAPSAFDDPGFDAPRVNPDDDTGPFDE